MAGKGFRLRNRWWRGMRAAIALAGAAWLMAACGGGGGESASSQGGGQAEVGAGGSGAPGGQPIKIGVSAPMSGSLATWGSDWDRATKLAVDQVNDSGGLLGRRLEVVTEDDAGEPQTAVTVAHRLVEQGVVAVIGPLASQQAIATEPVYADAGILMFVASSNPKVTEMNYDNVFRMAYRDDEAGPYDAETALQMLRAKTAAVVHDNSTYSKGLAEDFRRAFEKGGGQVLLFDAIVPGENDYSPMLTRIKSARPDVAYYSGYYPEGAALVRQARDLNVGVPFLLGGSNYDPKFLELAGAAAEGVIITGSVVPPTLDPSGQDYVKAYKARFGSEPGAFGHWAYDSVQVLAKAIRDTGSVDAAKLKEAVHAIAGFKGVSGEITFTPNGDRRHAPLARLVVKSGRFQLAEQP